MIARLWLALLLLVGCTTIERLDSLGVAATTCGDATTDATADAGTEAASDSAADVASDTTTDASDAADVTEAATDAQDASVDHADSGASEAASDAVADASTDSAVDAPLEAEAGTAPYVRQWGNQVWNPSAGTGQDLYVTLSNILAGSTVLVFVTEYNVSGSPAGTGPLSPITISDTASSVYVGPLDSVNSPPDYEGVLSYLATGVAPTTSLTVHAAFAPADEWTGLIAIEVANSSRVVAHGGNEVFNASHAQVMNGPTLAVGSAPALAISLYTNGFDNSGAPGVGSGWTSIVGAWNWAGLEGSATIPSTLLESRVASGTVTPTAVDLQSGSLQEDFLILDVALE